MENGNKLTGSFYTPENLIKYMVSYVREHSVPQTILEPAAGDGRFVKHLKVFNGQITLVEMDEAKTLDLQAQFSDECEICCCDFLKFAQDHEQKYDLIIGNPPYISKKMLSAEQRELSLKTMQIYKLDDSLFQNIWVSFIVASLKLLSPQGAIFFVLPFEFLQVQYAEKLRGFLEEKFNNIEITTFEERVFPDIEQDVCLVYLSNEVQEKPYVKYKTLISDSNTSQTFESTIMRNKPLRKWSNCILNDSETDTLIDLANRFPKTREFGEISPGIVTGANAFFILSKSKIDSLEVSPSYQLPIIAKGSSVPPLLFFTANDFELIAQSNVGTYLMNLTGLSHDIFSSPLIKYLETGKQREIDKRYKCEKRARWHDVPIIKQGDVCFFKRFHLLPRIIVNSAEVHTTDISYNIRFFEGYHPASFAFCFYNSLTMALCEYSGRFYGGGVGELVPNEFKSLSVPYMKVEDENLQHLDSLLRKEELTSEIIDYVDSIVLSKLSSHEINLLQDIRTRYLTRRMRLYVRKDADYEQ